jgi:hypothetical protein
LQSELNLQSLRPFEKSNIPPSHSNVTIEGNSSHTKVSPSNVKVSTLN